MGAKEIQLQYDEAREALQRWNALRAKFEKELLAPQSRLSFKKLAPLLPSAYPDHLALWAYLSAPTTPFSEKREITKALFLANREKHPGAPLALALLWLALWPWLDGVFRRQLINWRHPPDELASEILVRTTAQIQRPDIDPQGNLLATIPMNVERQLIDNRQRAIAQEAVTVSYSDPGLEELIEARALSTSPPPGTPKAPRVLWGWLIKTLGETKAALVIGRIEGEQLSRTQGAERVALSRALKALKEELSNDPELLEDFLEDFEKQG